MRVALISRYFLPYQVGGAEFHVANLATELACNGHDVHIFTSTDSATKTKIAQPAMEKNDKFTIHYMPSRCGAIAPDLRYFDLIHIHGYFRMLTNYIVLRWSSAKPIILTLHGSILGPYHQSQQQIYKYAKIYHDRLVFRLISRKVQKIIAITCMEKQFLCKFGIPSTRIAVIPNGISDEAFLPYDNEPRFIAWPYLLTISRLAKVKSINHVIQVLPFVSSDIHYVVAGPDEGELENLKQLANAYGVENRVHFVGPVFGSKKYTLLRNAFAFVLPSSFEAQPTVLIEAMAQGVPIIASNVGGVPEIVSKKTGFLYDYGDLKTLQYDIEYCYQKGKLVKDTNSLRQEMNSMYSWKAVVKKVVKVYHEVISD